MDTTELIGEGTTIEKAAEAGICVAPWGPSQVLALRYRQLCGNKHPYTCENRHEKPGFGDFPIDDSNLTPTEAGWVCRHCDYTQTWAHATDCETAPGLVFSDPRLTANDGVFDTRTISLYELLFELTQFPLCFKPDFGLIFPRLFARPNRCLPGFKLSKGGPVGVRDDKRIPEGVIYRYPVRETRAFITANWSPGQEAGILPIVRQAREQARSDFDIGLRE